MTSEQTGNTNPKTASWSGIMDNEGRLHLSLYFKNLSNEDLIESLGRAIDDSEKLMFAKGYIPADAHIMSSRDLAAKYGSSRQYWEKLIRTGRIPFQQTSASCITVDLWVAGYLKNKEEVDQYVRWQDQVIDLIQQTARPYSPIECPKCHEIQFDFANNKNEINGICRARCGFEFTRSIK